MKLINQLIIAILLSTSLFAQGWHRATAKECSAESHRELKAMNAMGLYGDPPISLGMSMFFADEGYSETQCGYTDGKTFVTRHAIWYRRKEYRVSKAEYESLFPTCKDNEHVRCFSHKVFLRLAKKKAKGHFDGFEFDINDTAYTNIQWGVPKGLQQ